MTYKRFYALNIGETDFEKILLVTNMYLSKQNPACGLFIKNTEDLLKDENDRYSLLRHICGGDCPKTKMNVHRN